MFHPKLNIVVQILMSRRPVPAQNVELHVITSAWPRWCQDHHTLSDDDLLYCTPRHAVRGLDGGKMIVAHSRHDVTPAAHWWLVGGGMPLNGNRAAGASSTVSDQTHVCVGRSFL
jgi:hypothetical protein